MPSVSGRLDSDKKQLVGNISLSSQQLRTGKIDATNSPSYQKNYNALINKPSINGVELRGDIDSDNLNILRPLTDTEIDQIMVVPEEV